MKRGRLWMLLLSIVFTISPLISAASFGIYGSPFDYFDNEWVMFSIVLLLLFAGIYSFFKNRMQSQGPAAILSLGLSILITIPIMQRGLLDTFLSETIVNLLILIALIVFIVVLFFKFSFSTDNYGKKKFKILRFFFFLVISAFVLSLIKDYLPEIIMEGTIGNMINNIENLGWNLIIIIIISFAAYWGFKWFSGRRGKNAQGPRNYGGGTTP